MKGIVIYDSSFGNTKQIAEAIAESLRESDVDVDLFYVKDVKKLNGEDYDFLVLGSPTKLGTMSLTVRFFLGKIKEKEWSDKPFVAFDTENPENIEKSETENKDWSAAEKISEKLKDKKMKLVSPVLKSVVFGQKGPLKEGEVERAKNYAVELAAKLKKE